MERHRDFRLQRGISICFPDVVSALKTQVLAEFLSLTLQDTDENITTWVCENQACTRGTQPPLNNSGAGSLVPGPLLGSPPAFLQPSLGPPHLRVHCKPHPGARPSDRRLPRSQHGASFIQAATPRCPQGGPTSTATSTWE